MSVSTTSLTVPPRPARTSLTSVRRTAAQLHVRCGPIGPISDELATGRMLGPAAIAARATSANERSDCRGARSAPRSASSWPAGLILWAIVWVRISMLDGSGGGENEPGMAGMTVSENMTDIRSVAATPSTMQWSTFDSSAQRPSWRPSTIHSSYSGLFLSRCWEKMRAAIWRSCSSLPAAGSALWRRW
jgi:hypothetical protein